MKLGVLSDVHPNLVALEAVLADGVAQGLTDWWVLGDLVAIGPEPVATLERPTALPKVVQRREQIRFPAARPDAPRPPAEPPA